MLRPLGARAPRVGFEPRAQGARPARIFALGARRAWLPQVFDGYGAAGPPGSPAVDAALLDAWEYV